MLYIYQAFSVSRYIDEGAPSFYLPVYLSELSKSVFAQLQDNELILKKVLLENFL